MNKLNFYTKLYGRLYNYGMPFWVMTPARRIVRYLANKQLPKYLAKKQEQRPKKEDNLIVSFTSFPKRAGNLWKVVESLKNQTILPEKIILWLSKDQFLTESDIPQSLLDQQDNLFEIRMVDKDVRSHKKYYYALLDFPDKTIITVDDDIYYDNRLIERLVTTSRQYPGCIIANHVCRILFDNNKEPLPYLQFGREVKSFESDNLMQIGVGGVLYPPHSLDPRVTDVETFQKVAPLADDIWLSTMARLHNTPVVKTYFDPLSLPITSDAPRLSDVNNGQQNMNDVQVAQIRSWLKENNLPDVFCSDYDVRNTRRGGVIVSLTSFPGRIDSVWQVIECMLRQTQQPQKIILWLAKEQFLEEGSVPQQLQDLQNEIFEIRFVDRDLRSHKKYYYVSQQFPNSTVLLIDDDIYYPTTMIETLYNKYQQGKNVVCNYGKQIVRDAKGDVIPYNQWSEKHRYESDSEIFFGSGGGVMFCPADLYQDLTNIDIALRLTPTADDIWLNTMVRLANLSVVKVEATGLLLPVAEKRDAPKLFAINITQNDAQINAINDYYQQVLNRKVF